MSAESSGVHIGVGVWFIMRVNFKEMCMEVFFPALTSAMCLTQCFARFLSEDLVPVARIQKRLLHLLSQKCELHMTAQMHTQELPNPREDDSFHPALKQPECK